MFLKFCFGVFLILLCTDSNAQIELVGVPYHTNKSNSSLQENFHSFSLFQIDANSINTNLKGKNDMVVSVSLGKSVRADVVLFKNEIYASSYSAITDGGEDLGIDQSQLAQHYEGYIMDDPSSEVRISFADDYIYGYIRQDNQLKYIEPASSFDKRIAKNAFIVYSPSDVKVSKGNFCAHTHVNEKIKETAQSTKSAVDCGILDVAIALDNSYVEAYNNNAGAINQSTSILNMVEANYSSNAFSKNFKFSIVQHFIPSGGDPWTSSADAAELLNSFTNWGPTGFTAIHDIGQFWTNRNTYFTDQETGQLNFSVAGLAWVGTVCSNAKYHILEDFSSTAWQLRVLTAHEMGHNFGSNHDEAPGNIMAGSVTVNTNSWSATSVAAINARLESFNCFEECFQGSCSEITNVATSDCTNGVVATYTLTIDLTHGGGANGSEGFFVNVDGGSFFRAWSTSPQTVVINGLESNGSIDHPITIVADNGTDEGCRGSAVFDEPSADCSINDTENFNSCTKPEGWTIESTNTISINGGDPLVQYQWKFLGTDRTINNYRSFSNASTTRTLDGTCMAIMDDDIFSGNIYSGTVTMETPTYDASNLQSLLLEFDYLFHPFEEGGKGSNNSYFRVEVWDGSKYVSILNDQDSDSNCPWFNIWQSQCIESASIDVSEYMNEEFSVRFIYSDQVSYAGMAAVDNYSLTGIPFPAPDPIEGDCNEVTLVHGGEDVSGNFASSGVLMTDDNVIVTGPTLFEASSVELRPGFRVDQGIEFTVQTGDCGTF